MLGLAAAAIVLRVVPTLVPGDVARFDEVGVDEVTVAFTVGLSVFVGLLSGVIPALQWSRLHLTRALNEGSAQSAGGFRLLRSNRSRAVLVMAQVALALVLLIGTGLLLRSFVRLVTFDRGYDPANVVSTAALFPFFEPDTRVAGSNGRPGSVVPATPRAATRGDDGAAGAPSGCRSVRVVEAPAPRQEPYQ